IDQLKAMPDADKDLLAAIAKNEELWDDTTEASIDAQEETQKLLASAVKKATDPKMKYVLSKLTELQDYFSDKTVFIIGGDGWAYDIGYGGVDHVVASGRNVKILVVDTEVYSNTGGQASKSTPLAAVAKFAASGKKLGKKNMGFMCMSYGYVYVASIALGANRNQAQQVLQEAIAYNGPAIVFCYAPCKEQGVKDMRFSQEEEKKAVDCGYWPLYRYNPDKPEGEKFTWETKPATKPYQDFLDGEVRYSSLRKVNPAQADDLFAKAAEDAKHRLSFYEKVGPLM
ncbi:MAG: thiamine pyrophosphate-dependent enzyme, partial [Sphaerochaetaceae bacterium]